MIVKRREDLLTALQCSVLSLSPDLDLEFKTFSIFPLQTQIGAPGGGTWPAGTSNQSPAAVKFSVQDSSSSFQLTPRSVSSSASKSCIRRFVITEKAPQRSLKVKLGPRHKGHKGRAVWLA